MLYRRPFKQLKHQINNMITAPQVRLIGEDNKQVGVLSLSDALSYTRERDLDLVLVAHSAVPPVARAVDYNKFLYQEAKKEREAKKEQKNTGIKELKIGGPFIGDADLQARLARIKEFISDGFSVRLVVKFTGRQMAHPEFGFTLMERIKQELGDSIKVDKDPKFAGKFLSMMIVQNKKNETKNP